AVVEFDGVSGALVLFASTTDVMRTGVPGVASFTEPSAQVGPNGCCSIELGIYISMITSHLPVQPMLVPVPLSLTYSVVPLPPEVFKYKSHGLPLMLPFGLPAPVYRMQTALKRVPA